MQIPNTADEFLEKLEASTEVQGIEGYLPIPAPVLLLQIGAEAEYLAKLLMIAEEGDPEINQVRNNLVNMNLAMRTKFEEFYFLTKGSVTFNNLPEDLSKREVCFRHIIPICSAIYRRLNSNKEGPNDAEAPDNRPE